MRGLRLAVVLLVLACSLGAAEPPTPTVRFMAVDVWIDSGEAPLAAWQIEVNYDAAHVRLVGVEGGEGAFQDAPYFDEAGMTGGRIILAGFTTDDARAPTGRTRVARLHLRLEGTAVPDVNAALRAAARPGGERIPATVTVGTPENKEGD